MIMDRTNVLVIMDRTNVPVSMDRTNVNVIMYTISRATLKGEFQICPRMDFVNILYVEYLRYNIYKNEIILFLEGC